MSDGGDTATVAVNVELPVVAKPEEPKPEPKPEPTPTAVTKVEEKEEKKADTGVKIERKKGYVAPRVPLVKFSRFVKLFFYATAPLLLAQIFLSIVFIVQVTIYIQDAFDGAQGTLALMATYILKSQLLLPSNASLCATPDADYTADFGINARALISQTITCGTVLKYADFSSGKLYVHAEFLSQQLCADFIDDYFEEYAYEGMVSGITVCQDAQDMIPTDARVWNPATQNFVPLPPAQQKPKKLANSLAVQYITPIVAICVVLFGIHWKYFYPRFINLEPLTELELVQMLFKSQNDGLFMSSYQWNDRVDAKDPQGKIPRKLAALLPHAWLDLENLIPGTQIAPTCNAAARNALFRFAFISKDYFASKNCGVEWVEIKDQPERTFIFAYPSTPPEKLKELEAAGHTIYNMPDVHLDVGPAWLNEHLIQSRAANVVFRQKTPPINENWLPTLRFYFASPDWQWFTVPTPILLFWVGLIIFHVAYISSYNIWTVFNAPSSTIGYLAFFIPLVGIACCLYVSYSLKGTGFHAPHFVYACQLLYLLKHLNIIDTQTFYTNCKDDIHGLDELEKMEIIKIVPESEMKTADIRLLNIDSLSDLPSPRPQDSIWASKGFMELDQSVRDKIGSFLIGGKKDICEIEFVACKILIGGFRCASTDALSVGSKGWQKIHLKSALG